MLITGIITKPGTVFNYLLLSLAALVIMMQLKRAQLVKRLNQINLTNSISFQHNAVQKLACKAFKDAVSSNLLAFRKLQRTQTVY